MLLTAFAVFAVDAPQRGLEHAFRCRQSSTRAYQETDLFFCFCFLLAVIIVLIDESSGIEKSKNLKPSTEDQSIESLKLQDLFNCQQKSGLTKSGGVLYFFKKNRYWLSNHTTNHASQFVLLVTN